MTYEGMFVLDAGIAVSWDAVEGEIKRLMDRAEAELLCCRKWDDRRLAYEIKGRKRGYYVLTYFRADPGRIVGLERDVQLSETVLRVLVLRADKVSEEEIARQAREAAEEAAVMRGAAEKAAAAKEEGAEKAAEEAEAASEAQSVEPAASDEPAEATEATEAESKSPQPEPESSTAAEPADLTDTAPEPAPLPDTQEESQTVSQPEEEEK
jgi:small subunit ribosomal protein S6